MNSDVHPVVQVRRIVDSDLESLRALRLRALATDPMAFGDTLESAQKSDLSGWEEWVQRASSSDDATTFFAHLPDGRLVGMIGSTWKEGITWLGAMWVEPPFRGLRVGARLLDSVLSWSDSIHPGSEIRLYVATIQDAAIRLYQSRGFVNTGTVYPHEHPLGSVFHEMLRTPKSPQR